MSGSKKTFAGEFAKSFSEKLKESELFGLKGAFNEVRDGATEVIAETAANYVMKETSEVVEQIKEDSAQIINQTAMNLNPEQRDTWELIRNSVAPEGGFIKTIFARLLWIGAKASSFIGALVVDRWTGRSEMGQNTPNIEYILAWLLGKTVEDHKQLSQGSRRALGIPRTWVSSNPAVA